MPTAWIATDLSVDPPSRQMADTDVETFAFDAGQAITADTAAVLTRLNTGEAVNDLIANTDVEGEVASVTVAGLTRGVTYELAVTLVNAAGRRWTKTLVLECVS